MLCQSLLVNCRSSHTVQSSGVGSSEHPQGRSFQRTEAPWTRGYRLFEGEDYLSSTILSNNTPRCEDQQFEVSAIGPTIPMADDIVTRRAWLSLALCFFALSTITGLFLLGKQDGYDDIAGQARTRNRKGPAGLPRAIFSRANANRKETSLTFDLLVGTELLCTMIDYENLLEVLHTDIRTPIPETTVSKIISLPPFVTVPGVSNIRDLSHGADLRPGLVFRSGNISDITGEGKTILAGKLNISTIYDLRNQGERERAAPPQIDGVEIAWMPYGARPATLNLRDFAGEDKSADGFVKMYMGILEANTPIFSQVFAHIRDQPHEPFLFHCSGECPDPEIASVLRVVSVTRGLGVVVLIPCLCYSWQGSHRSARRHDPASD